MATRFDRGIEAKSIALGVKLHFASESYNYDVYGPKRMKRRTFEASNDKFMWMRLGSLMDDRDIFEYVLKMTVDRDGKTPWIGELLSPDMVRVANAATSRRGSFAKHFEDDVFMVVESLGSEFATWITGGIPPLADLALNKRIGFDSFCVIANVLGGTQRFVAHDGVTWPSFVRTMNRYERLAPRLDTATAARIMRKQVEVKREKEKHERDATELRRSDERVFDDDHSKDARDERPGIQGL